MKNLTFLFLLLSIILLSLGFELPLKEKQDLNKGWKFPKNHQFHYFPTTKDIPHSFLPVKIDHLPEKRGVWLLRHKDLLELPESFSGNEEGEHDGPASINYSTSSIFFWAIRIKLFVYGDVDLTLLTKAGHEVRGNKRGHRHHDPKNEVSLGGNHYNNCSKSDEDSNQSDSSFRWVTYEIQMSEGATKMELQVNIAKPKSFVILDEIDIIYADPAVPSPTDVDDTYNWSEEGISDAISIKKNLYHVHCSV